MLACALSLLTRGPQTYVDEAAALLRPGVCPEDARLAVAMIGDVSDASAVFAENVGKLRAMGFARETVCGALLQANNDLERASDRLLTS